MVTVLRSSLSLGIGLILTLGAACTGTPTSAPRGSAEPPTERPTTSTSLIPGDGPPPSLAPTPATGGLADVALRFRACDIVCYLDPGLVVLTDGRVLQNAEGGMTVRQLTSAGMAVLMDAVRGTGLFTDDATFEPVLNPDKQSMGFGPMSYDFDLGSGEAAVHVRSVSPGGFEADNQQGREVWTIPPEVYILEDLATRLQQLRAWLPAEAWAGPAQPYTADRYLLITTIEGVKGALPPFPDIDTVDWPFPKSVEFAGEPFVRTDLTDGDSRCLVVSRDQAAEMAEVEGAGPAGRIRDLRLPYQQLHYSWRRGHGSVDVTTKMVLPYQEPSCEGAGAW